MVPNWLYNFELEITLALNPNQIPEKVILKSGDVLYDFSGGEDWWLAIILQQSYSNIINEFIDNNQIIGNTNNLEIIERVAVIWETVGFYYTNLNPKKLPEGLLKLYQLTKRLQGFIPRLIPPENKKET